MKKPSFAMTPLLLALWALGAAAQQPPEPPIVTEGYRPTLTPPVAPAAVARQAAPKPAVAATPAPPAPAAAVAPPAAPANPAPPAQQAAATQPKPTGEKPAPRRSVQAVIEGMPVKPPLVTEGSRPSLAPPAPSPNPAGPATVNSCDAGGCTDVGGTRYNTGVGDATVSGQGRLCNRNGTTVQCF